MKHIIPVVSGKGGVGKSTVAVNLAIALGKMGAKVGLIDADFYGPSIPTLLGGGDVKPDSDEKLIPASKFGIKYVSIGFFLSNPDDPVVWRGPMFTKALQQLFSDVKWGDLDYCIIDMPPGTGDAQLSLAQMVKLSGAVVVTTPQEVAMADVRKMLNMLEKVNVPVYGLVENMSGFTTESGEKVNIFGEGGGELLAKKFNLPLLSSIPIDMDLRIGGDKGCPASIDKDNIAKLFDDLAEKLVGLVDQVDSQASEGLKVVN